MNTKTNIEDLIGYYEAVCIGVKGDEDEFKDLIGKKGILKIYGSDAYFRDVAMCEIKVKQQENVLIIKTSYNNVFSFEV